MRWQPKWRAQALFALDGLTRRNVALESESVWAADKRAAVLITNDVDVDAKRGLALIAFHAEGRLLAALFADITLAVLAFQASLIGAGPGSADLITLRGWIACKPQMWSSMISSPIQSF